MNKIHFKLRGKQQSLEGHFDSQNGKLLLDGHSYELHRFPWDVPVSGTVYGTLLNYKGTLESMDDVLHEAPYKEPPKAPILYIKPINTMIGCNLSIPLPNGIPELEVGAALGIVIGQTATKINEEMAYNYIGGYTIVNDISIPHENVYRPAISQKARDGFCPIGPWVVKKHAAMNPDNLGIRVYINGELRQSNTTANLIRPVSRLLSDITEFMTLNAGDVVLVGIPENPPLAKAGDRIRIEIDGIGQLENKVEREDVLVREEGL